MSSIANTGEMTILEIEQLNNSLKYGQKFGIAQRLMAIQYTQVGATITQILRLEDDEYLKFGTGSDESAPATDWDIRAYFDNTNLLWVGRTERIGKVIYDNIEVNIGEFSSTTAGAGLPMDADSGAFRVYTDDDGVSMTGSGRGILSRMLFTLDQTGGATYRAVQGQIKIVNDVDLNHAGHVITSVEGYMEWDGTADHIVDGHIACVRAALEEGASGTTTIDATGYFSGFEATLNSSRTYTVNGVMAGFLAGIDNGTSKWPIGFLAHKDGCAIGFQSGAHSSSTGSGIPVSGASATVRFHSDEGNVDNSGNLRCLLARHLTEANQTGAQTRSGAQLQCKIQGANIDDNSHWQGSHSYLEVDGTCTLGDGTNVAYFAGCRGVIEFASGATITLSANSFASAFRAEWDDAAGATVTGTPGAYMIATPVNGNFVNAIIFESAGAAYPCGVKASVASPSGNTTHAIKVDIAGTAGYIPVYAAESF